MTYTVREIFYTLQGEGAHSGRPAVFCRFSGCNLWSGREADRASAVCRFCDTDFVGTTGEKGGQYRSSTELAREICALWPAGCPDRKFVVFTGGEPLLQLDAELISVVHSDGFEIAIETNGTLPVLPDIDWVCVSPKAGAALVQTSGDELKLVVPQAGQILEEYEQLPFKHFYLQPLDNAERFANTRWAIEACMRRPRWKLSLQIHKYLGIA
ncbi:MAG: 7-carboxy-7-deazaguanine synthase [Burkholderiaceae bacterium]|nr:7-carboxy-7-deazaguanine synthase [Burkholderiaceae bacterium]